MHKQLRKSEIKDISPKLEKYGCIVGKKDDLKLDGNILLVNGKPDFFLYEDMIIPRLNSRQEYLMNLKKVTVDMGAVKPLSSGSDLMKPGIRDIDLGIEKGDPIAIVDEKNKMPFVIGIALLSSQDMEKADSGKVVKNIHRPSDEIWNYN
ncbi:MAG: PUA domain-containing protein [Candidatus Woesearchaeota archaeon]